MKKFCLLICIVSLIAFALVGCSTPTFADQTLHFGQFGYKGRMLPEYAVRTITANEAKRLIASVGTATASVKIAAKVALTSVGSEHTYEVSAPSEELVNRTLQQYSECIITTKYYVEGKDQVQTKEDRLLGTDLKYMLTINQFVPFSQLVAKNILVFDELIESMEEQNRLFERSQAALIAPFRSIFSYHTDDAGNLVIQTRDFAEIPSSVGGGIGCSYRQDTEIVYDDEGKMTLWQTSLGLYSSSPQGTMQDGYILEMEVKWIEKS